MKKLTYVLSFIFILASLFVISSCSKNDPDTEGGIAVTSITISGAGKVSAITTAKGSLQMSAVVLPANATNKKVTWTVVNGTGIASITSKGLLTATTNGTVTVNATSVSNKTIKGSLVVTISNQPAVDMNSTLTNLTVDGIAVMGFTPLQENYVMVLPSGKTSTPVAVATKYQATATAVINAATDVTSTLEASRTTTVVVTSKDGLETKTYSILFESSILPVDLKSAEDFVVLAQTGISTATTSAITGDIGVSPAAATYITGFSLILDSTGVFSTSSQVTGKVFSSDYTVPTKTKLITAVDDMQTAYVDAAGRAANYNELHAGDLSGKTLTTGVYKYSSSVLINTDLTLSGSATDIWIFQIAGQLTQAANIKITLTGGALAENVVWQVADTVSIGTGADFKGIILAKTNISVGTNASISGQLYAQTAVTLDANIIVKP